MTIWQAYRALCAPGQEPFDRVSRRARDEIVTAHMPLARKVASRATQAMPSHVIRQDIESLAFEGLLKAVTQFDPERKVPFEAFATQMMQRKIVDGARELDWAPRSLRKMIRDIGKAEEGLRQRLGRSPSQDELAEDMGVTTQEIFEARRKAEVASHAYIAEDPEAYDTASPDSENEAAKLIREAIVSAIRKLPMREQVVIALHYYEEKRIVDIAGILGVSEVNVGKLHTAAVMHIWEQLNEVRAS